MSSSSPDFNNVGFNLYGFSPSKAAPIIMAVAFATGAVVHFMLVRRHCSARITGPLVFACVVFTAGFCVREASIFYDQNLNLFIAMQVLLIAAPPIFSLANYLIFGRALYYVPYLSPLHPGRVLTTFVGLDVVVEILTGNGASKITRADSTPAQVNIGKALLRASLLLQLALFGLFVGLEIFVHRRCLRAGVMSPNLRTIFATLYASSALILTRNVFRVLETWDYERQPSAYLNRHEAFMYCFDALLMLSNAVIFAIWHPATKLPKDHRVYLTRDGKTEALGPGWYDKRAWYVTVIDPFDLWGLIRGRDKQNGDWWNGQGQTIAGAETTEMREGSGQVGGGGKSGA